MLAPQVGEHHVQVVSHMAYQFPFKAHDIAADYAEHGVGMQVFQSRASHNSDIFWSQM